MTNTNQQLIDELRADPTRQQYSRSQSPTTASMRAPSSTILNGETCPSPM